MRRSRCTFAGVVSSSSTSTSTWCVTLPATSTVRDWDTFESRVELLGYTDASRAVARAGETFGLALLAAWEPTLDADVAAILAATADRAMVDKDCYHRYQR